MCLLHSGSAEPQDVLGNRASILLEQGPCPVFAEPSKPELLDGIEGFHEPVSGRGHVLALAATKSARGILSVPRNPEVST
eukprot:6386898-Alexandrium_andersonii.AAC.1